MITRDGYSIYYWKSMNELRISLPPTLETANSTAVPVAKRRIEITDEELAALLIAAIGIFEDGGSQE